MATPFRVPRQVEPQPVPVPIELRIEAAARALCRLTLAKAEFIDRDSAKIDAVVGMLWRNHIEPARAVLAAIDSLAVPAVNAMIEQRLKHGDAT